MGTNLFEVKAMLRSILISTPNVMSVFQLNWDFKEQEGIGIPYEKFGYKTLMEFLRSIPDVLLVNGNSRYSKITLVASVKSSHVNELVMKQKSAKKCRTPRRSTAPIFNSNKRVLPNTSQENLREITNVKVNSKPDDGYSSQKSYSDKSNKSRKPITKENSSFSQNNTKLNMVKNKTPKCNGENLRENIPSLFSTIIKDIPDFSKNKCREHSKTNKTAVESTKLLRRINYKESSPNMNNSQKEDSLYGMDISLRGSDKQETNYWKGGTIRTSRKRNNAVEYCSEADHTSEKNIKSSGSTGSGYLTKNSSYDWMHGLQRTKTKETHNKKYKSKPASKINNSIPKEVQDNLRKLISDFPEGIWCAELPTVYKNIIGEELRFEDYGYRYLFHLCLDLENIFHCVKESPCDYKIYDTRNPLPEFNIVQEYNYEETAKVQSTPAIPEMIWGSFDTFLPEDAVRLGFQLDRIQVSEKLETGTSSSVMVAEIYDISKFWIILDDTKLENLMGDMQCFYGSNGKSYLVPKSLLEEGLYCVVLYQDKFHRAVILNVMPDEEFVKVNYLDYGTLGTVSKSEVWFMTQEFSELPTQAIRARLADIYPPYEGVTWSPFANYEFSNLTCMKKLTAEIVRIDKNKNLVDIKLKNSHSYVSDILVKGDHAIFINKPPRKHIEDPNCKSRVKFIHLFPTFEEIENWVVPSVEEAADFLSTPVTADFLYSQYFSRTDHEDLINSIEEKMRIWCTKKKLLLKHFNSTELLSSNNMVEMNKIAYGALYEETEEAKVDESDIKENFMKENETTRSAIEETIPVEEQNVSSENKRLIDIKDDELLIGILRQTRMKKSYSFEEDKYQKDSDTIFNRKKSKTSILRNKGMKEKELESNSRGPLIMIDQSCKKTFNRVFKDFSSFSDLEKYLSDEDSSKTSKKSTSTLFDLDNDFSPIIPSTNLLLDSEFENSQVTLALSRQKQQKCLLTGSTSSDVENMGNPLDLPIPSDIDRSLFQDLIQLDVEVSVPEVSCACDEQVGVMPADTQIIFQVDCSKSNDADDEDSDVGLNSLEYPGKSDHLKASRKKKTNHESSQMKNLIDNNSFTISETSQLSDRISIKNIFSSSPLQLKEPIFVDQDDFTASNSSNSKLENSGDENDCFTDYLIMDQRVRGKQHLPVTSDLLIHSRYFNNSLDLTENNKSKILEVNISELTDGSNVNENNYVPKLLEQETQNDKLNISMVQKIEKMANDHFGSISGNKENKKQNIPNLAYLGSAVNENKFSDSSIQKFPHQGTREGDCTSSKEFNLTSEKSIGISNSASNKLVANQSTVEGNHLSTAVDSPSFLNSSIATIDSAELELEHVESPTSKSSNMYYSCGSNHLSVQDSSFENIYDFPTFGNNGNSENASTPLPSASHKDKSFLEEFEILDPSCTSSSISDLTSEAVLSRLSFVSGEWMSLEMSTSQLDPGSSNGPQFTEPDVSEAKDVLSRISFVSGESMSLELSSSQCELETNVLQSSEPEALVETAETLVNSTSFNCEPQINSPKHVLEEHLPSNNDVPLSNPTPLFVGVQTVMNPPRMLVCRPPPGFLPLSANGQQSVLFPYTPPFYVPMNHQNVPRHTILGPQQVIVNEVAQDCNNYPIVIFNYNFLPPLNQNSH